MLYAVYVWNRMSNKWEFRYHAGKNDMVDTPSILIPCPDVRQAVPDVIDRPAPY